ncbi:MAG: TPM domain-containing protein [Acetobacterium sp.]|nr:TPM domain-containing protein [Acetobacterium sp.]
MGSGGNDNDNGSGRGSSGCGCGAVILVIIIILIIVVMLGLFTDSGSTELTKSTIAREPLPKGSVTETGYYSDDLGWINNQTKMQEGLKHFYQQTGVQPFVVITDTINGSHNPTESELDAYANQLYDQLFTDEAHLLFVFFEYNDAYMDRYVAGTQAKTVIDTEAADILLDYIDRNYYNNSLTDEEFFSNAFGDAADRIMTVTKSPWISALTVIVIIFGVVIITVLLFIWWRRAKNQKNLEAKQTAEMLNTPLEKFDDVEIEDLAKKYEDNPPATPDEHKD